MGRLTQALGYLNHKNPDIKWQKENLTKLAINEDMKSLRKIYRKNIDSKK
jgi:hypothetical protein